VNGSGEHLSDSDHRPPLQPTTLEASGPEGDFVIRADRGARPRQSFMRPPANKIFMAVVRFVRRDRAWGTVRVRRRATDPFGPDVYSQLISTSDELGPAIDRAVELIKSGRILGALSHRKE